jgi:hypothetical protein
MKRTTKTPEPQPTKPQPRQLDATELAAVTGGDGMKKRHEMSM